jgi:hypothetical protein
MPMISATPAARTRRGDAAMLDRFGPRTLLISLIAATLLLAFAGPAYAHGGTITATEDCVAFHVTVTLHHNVTPDRSVQIVTTIPGTHGFTGHHFNKTFGVIWRASGPAPAIGVVTLNIYRPDHTLEFTTHASVQPAAGCPT